MFKHSFFCWHFLDFNLADRDSDHSLNILLLIFTVIVGIVLKFFCWKFMHFLFLYYIPPGYRGFRTLHNADRNMQNRQQVFINFALLLGCSYRVFGPLGHFLSMSIAMLALGTRPDMTLFSTKFMICGTGSSITFCTSWTRFFKMAETNINNGNPLVTSIPYLLFPLN